MRDEEPRPAEAEYPSTCARPRRSPWGLVRFVRRYLAPADRLAETLCGLIMVLTFTLAAAPQVKEGPEGVRQLLLATLGCNIAWGIIDGALYVLCAMSQRALRANFLRRVKEAPGEDAAAAVVRGRLEEEYPSESSADERERLYRAMVPVLLKTRVTPGSIKAEDVFGGLAILVVEVTCTLPAVVPFLFIRDHWLALRASNGLLLLLLFGVGYQWGSHTTGRPKTTGFVMLVIGAALVGIALALGG